MNCAKHCQPLLNKQIGRINLDNVFHRFTLSHHFRTGHHWPLASAACTRTASLGSVSCWAKVSVALQCMSCSHATVMSVLFSLSYKRPSQSFTCISISSLLLHECRVTRLFSAREQECNGLPKVTSLGQENSEHVKLHFIPSALQASATPLRTTMWESWAPFTKD